MSAVQTSDLRSRRQAVVQQHIDAENNGDLDAMIASFKTPRYEVFPMGAVFEGEDSVRALVAGLVGGFPDFNFAPTKIHHADDAVIVEASDDRNAQIRVGRHSAKGQQTRTAARLHLRF